MEIESPRAFVAFDSMINSIVTMVICYNIEHIKYNNLNN